MITTANNPVDSLETTGTLPKTKELALLWMPGNKSFHGRIVKVSKKYGTYKCNQLYTRYWQLEFERTDKTVDVKMKDKIIIAAVFEFRRIVSRQTYRNGCRRKGKV